MKETEVIKLFSIIRIEHPHFERTTEKALLWAELMKDLDFATALENLKDHLRRSEYPPKAADIIQQDKSKTTHDLLQQETEDRFLLLAQWEQAATSMPLHLKRGVGD